MAATPLFFFNYDLDIVIKIILSRFNSPNVNDNTIFK